VSEPNLRVHRRSRKRPRDGDVFVMMPPDEKYVFGRVMGADLPRSRAPMPEATLIYVYRWRSQWKEPDRDQLNARGLLLPPIFINNLPWSKGYFETIGNSPLRGDDWLSQHFFWDALREVFVDENGRALPAPVEPCDDWALHSYRTFDDALSEALGIPPAPE